jgi:carbonic anhydrase
VQANFPTDDSSDTDDSDSSTCEASTLQIPGVYGTFQALQFHMHTSSEHTLDKHRFSAELHIVHQQMDTGHSDRYAVVGMMIQPDDVEDNEEFELLLGGWYANENEVLEECGYDAAEDNDNDNAELSDALFSPYDLLPEGTAFYHYAGGLTTPPCSQVVWWNLADQPVSISVRQYSVLLQLIFQYRDSASCALATIASSSGGTSRPVQPLNGRKVKRICPVGFNGEMARSRSNMLSFSLGVMATLATGYMVFRGTNAWRRKSKSWPLIHTDITEQGSAWD